MKIPVFTAQLHKSRVATDEANCRSYYADCQSAFLMDDTDDSMKLSGVSEFELSDGQKITLNAGTITATYDEGKGYRVDYTDTVDGCGTQGWGAE